MAAHCSGCVFTAVCVHFGWVNAEHEFRVWVTIPGCMSRHFTTSLMLSSQRHYSHNEIQTQQVRGHQTWTLVLSRRPRYFACVCSHWMLEGNMKCSVSALSHETLIVNVWLSRSQRCQTTLSFSGSCYIIWPVTSSRPVRTQVWTHI